ncbi:MAG: DUF4160 domain-containing protein [Gallionellaceae bacterium]|jgi:hypothetical protein
MPKLYEYFGLIIMFYANEHDPVHVHGKFQDRESRAEIIVLNGEIAEIHYSNVTGRAPLEISEMRHFEELVSVRATDIVSKWIDFFVLHKPVKSERITRRLK